MTLQDQIHKKRNQFGKALIFSLFGILFFYTCLMFYFKAAKTEYRLSIDTPTVFFSFLIMGYFVFLSTKKNFNFWPMLRIITVGFYILVLYLTLLGCQRSMTCMFFFIPIVVIIMMQTTIKYSIITIIVTFVLCFFLIPYISKSLNLGPSKPLNETDFETLKYLTYTVSIISFYLSFLTLYYYIELNKLSNSAIKLEKNVPEGKKTVYKSKLALLHKEILDYMEVQKPYTNPDFSVKILAKKMKSNLSYVSKAINQEGGKSFSEFVQEYRINHVKEEFIKSKGQVAIEDAYKRAGFTHQSTFNKKFKDLVGKTPTQYCADLQKRLLYN